MNISLPSGVKCCPFAQCEKAWVGTVLTSSSHHASSFLDVALESKTFKKYAKLLFHFLSGPNQYRWQVISISDVCWVTCVIYVRWCQFSSQRASVHSTKITLPKPAGSAETRDWMVPRGYLTFQSIPSGQSLGDPLGQHTGKLKELILEIFCSVLIGFQPEMLPDRIVSLTAQTL